MPDPGVWQPDWHGLKNICAALLKENLLSLQAQLRNKTTNSQESKWSSLLAQYFLGKPETGPWPQNHHHHLPRVTQDCQEYTARKQREIRIEQQSYNSPQHSYECSPMADISKLKWYLIYWVRKCKFSYYSYRKGSCELKNVENNNLLKN